VRGDDKCFVVVYFELAKIGIVLPFYFLPFTFILRKLYTESFQQGTTQLDNQIF
jgi:hypothetical protein